MNTKPFIKGITILIGFIVAFLFIMLRVWRDARELSLIDKPTMVLFLFYIIYSVIHLMLGIIFTYKVLWLIHNWKTNGKKSKIFTWITEKILLPILIRVLNIINYFLDSMKVAYNAIFEYFQPQFLYVLAVKIMQFKFKKVLFIAKIIFFICEGLPRAIIVGTFLIEIEFYQRLYYFYYSLYLLIIPLIYQFVVYIFSHMPLRLFEIYDSMIEITRVKKRGNTYEDEDLLITYTDPQLNDAGKYLPASEIYNRCVNLELFQIFVDRYAEFCSKYLVYIKWLYHLLLGVGGVKILSIILQTREIIIH